MERKYQNYIKEWRKAAGLTQKQLLSRLQELVGDQQPDDPDMRVPLTEASLSRIENGKQNFSMATLRALADALQADEPGYLLDRNPLKEGKVISILDRLSPPEFERAAKVLEAMFGANAG